MISDIVSYSSSAEFLNVALSQCSIYSVAHSFEITTNSLSNVIGGFVADFFTAMYNAPSRLEEVRKELTQSYSIFETPSEKLKRWSDQASLDSLNKKLEKLWPTCKKKLAEKAIKEHYEEEVLRAERLSKKILKSNIRAKGICDAAILRAYPFSNLSANYTHLEIKNAHPDIDLDWLKEVNFSLMLQKLEVVDGGSSTSFLIRDTRGQIIAILKPTNFSGGASNSPKGMDVNFDLNKIKNAALKEVGAFYALYGFSSNPEVCLVDVNLAGTLRECSLQKYIEHTGNYSDLYKSILKTAVELCGINLTEDIIDKIAKQELSQREFALYYTQYIELQERLRSDLELKFKVVQKKKEVFKEHGSLYAFSEIHKVGLLQIITGNVDCNPKNYLTVKKEDGVVNIVPIDFNLAFQNDPNISLDWDSTIWFSSPYSSLPFEAETVEYFKKYNIDQVAQKLNQLGLDKQAIFNYKVRAYFAKTAISVGLSLKEIALQMIPSRFEKMFYKRSEITGKPFKTYKLEDPPLLKIIEESMCELHFLYDDLDDEQTAHFEKIIYQKVDQVLQQVLNEKKQNNGTLPAVKLSEALQSAKTLREFCDVNEEMWKYNNFNEMGPFQGLPEHVLVKHDKLSVDFKI